METQLNCIFFALFFSSILPICSCQRTLACLLPGNLEAFTPLPFHGPTKLIFPTDPQVEFGGRDWI